MHLKVRVLTNDFKRFADKCHSQKLNTTMGALQNEIQTRLLRHKLLFEKIIGGTAVDDIAYPALCQVLSMLHDTLQQLEEEVENMHHTLFVNKLADFAGDDHLKVFQSFL